MSENSSTYATFSINYDILFMNTSHNESKVAILGSIMQNMCKAVLPSSLRTHQTSLKHYKKKTRLRETPMLSTDSSPLPKFCFMKPVNQTSGHSTNQRHIVEESSATPCIRGVERLGIEATTLTTMCKFSDKMPRV